MINDNKVIEILEFIQTNNGKIIDYSVICESLTELMNYLHYMYDKGYISDLPSSFSSGNPRKHTTKIKPVESFQNFEQFAAIRIGSQGVDYLKETKKSTIQKLTDNIKENAISKTAEQFYKTVYFLLGILFVLFVLRFQYYTGIILK